jgi:hypothetical protein
MGVRGGNKTTDIVKDGLVLNIDAGNVASYDGNTTVLNTLDLDKSGSFEGAPTAQYTSSFNYLNFDGVDDWIRIDNDQFPSNRSAFTIEFIWSPWATHSGYRSGVATKWQTGGGSNNEWFLGRQGVGGISPFQFTVQINSSTGGYASVSSSINYTVDQWYHQVGTFDGGNNGFQKIYINGVGYQSTSSGATSCRTYTAQDVALSSFGSSYQYEGKNNIARFAYYNRALSDREVLQNYNGLKERFNLI